MAFFDLNFKALNNFMYFWPACLAVNLIGSDPIFIHAWTSCPNLIVLALHQSEVFRIKLVQWSFGSELLSENLADYQFKPLKVNLL